MNQFVPDWGNMGDTSRPLGEDDDIIELLWCNGHVIMQNQTHRKLPPRPEKAAAAAAAAQEDEAGLWFPFALADSLDKDIFSELFSEAPAAAAAGTAAGVDGGKPCRDAPLGDDKRGGACVVSEAPPRDLMPPPKSTHVSCSRQQTSSLADGSDNASDLSDLVRTRTAGAVGKAAMEAGASSMLSAIGSSICGSNQVQVQRAVSEPGRAGRVSDTARGGGGSGSVLPSAVGSANANASGRDHEATVASSSGRSNCCFGTTTTEPTSTSNKSSKRKRLDTESPSKDAESESAALARKRPQKLTTARRSRAAEVHNLSERRRRDRINEKMRALQELIPHCNKTDKASMLDEAIEYLKSLQLQVQMMWMGSGIAPPVMFPGVHQYLPRMGAAGMTSMPRMPFMTPQPVLPNTAAVNPVPLCVPQNHGPSGYRTHMPAVSLPEPYAHYLGVNHLQPSSQVSRAQCQLELGLGPCFFGPAQSTAGPARPKHGTARHVAGRAGPARTVGRAGPGKPARWAARHGTADRAVLGPARHEKHARARAARQARRCQRPAASGSTSPPQSPQIPNPHNHNPSIITEQRPERERGRRHTGQLG